jgi:hypothetical protein
MFPITNTHDVRTTLSRCRYEARLGGTDKYAIPARGSTAAGHSIAPTNTRSRPGARPQRGVLNRLRLRAPDLAALGRPIIGGGSGQRTCRRHATCDCARPDQQASRQRPPQRPRRLCRAPPTGATTLRYVLGHTTAAIATYMVVKYGGVRSHERCRFFDTSHRGPGRCLGTAAGSTAACSRGVARWWRRVAWRWRRLARRRRLEWRRLGRRVLLARRRFHWTARGLRATARLLRAASVLRPAGVLSAGIIPGPNEPLA